MAANEHKNLSSINRHNPKGFETATNDTILSKDGGTSATSTTLADADRFVVNDNGTMVQVAASDLITYVNSNSSAASTGKAIAMALVFG